MLDNSYKNLKPCPFCGGLAVMREKDWDEDFDKHHIAGYYVVCTQCNATPYTVLFSYEKEDFTEEENRAKNAVVEKWNCRFEVGQMVENSKLKINPCSSNKKTNKEKKMNTMKSETVSDFIYDFANGEMYYVDVDTKEVLLNILGANDHEEISFPFKDEEDMTKFLQTFATNLPKVLTIESARQHLLTLVTEEMKTRMNEWLNKDKKGE